MLLRMIRVLLVLRRMLSSILGNHLQKERQLHLHESDLLQIEGLSHPGVHPIHLLDVVLIRHLCVVDQMLPPCGVVTHLLAGDQDLQLEDVLLLHRLEGIGHRCARHLGGVVAAHHHAGAPLGLLDGGHHPQGG